jgi:glycosyltransferase involved in cell wall biosynthesis
VNEPHPSRPILNIAILQRFLPSRSRGGVGVFTDGLATSLQQRGHAVTVFSQDPAPEGAAYAVSPVAVTAGRLAPLAFPLAVRRCDFTSFDVLHAQGDEQWLPWQGRPPVVRTLHGTALAEAWFNGVRQLSPRLLALHSYFYLGECVADVRADVVVAVSRHTTRFYPRVDVVIPNGIDVAAWAPDGSSKSPAPSILFIGEVDSRKRGRMLVDAFSQRVRAQISDAQLWLVSPDRVDGPGIEWKGRVGDGALRALMRRAWIMCLPSAYEGFGRPYAEALAAGTAVVATSNPGAREVLDDGRYGVIAPDDQLGDALVRVLSHADERAAFERSGLERAKAFDWPAVAAAYERAYALAIERAPRRHG